MPTHCWGVWGSYGGLQADLRGAGGVAAPLRRNKFNFFVGCPSSARLVCGAGQSQTKVGHVGCCSFQSGAKSDMFNTTADGTVVVKYIYIYIYIYTYRQLNMFSSPSPEIWSCGHLESCSYAYFTILTF